MKSNGKKYNAKFSCGHYANIHFWGELDLLKKLEHAEKNGLCPDCKRKEFIKTAVKREIPYHAYKDLLQKKRGVITGEYKDGKITVYLSEKVNQRFEYEFNKIYYDIEITKIVNGENHIITVFINGYNTYRLKNELKRLGFCFNWDKKRWQKNLEVLLSVDENGNTLLLLQRNPACETLIKELELLECEKNPHKTC